MCFLYVLGEGKLVWRKGSIIKVTTAQCIPQANFCANEPRILQAGKGGTRMASPKTYRCKHNEYWFYILCLPIHSDSGAGGWLSYTIWAWWCRMENRHGCTSVRTMSSSIFAAQSKASLPALWKHFMQQVYQSITSSDAYGVHGSCAYLRDLPADDRVRERVFRGTFFILLVPTPALRV